LVGHGKPRVSRLAGRPGRAHRFDGSDDLTADGGIRRKGRGGVDQLTQVSKGGLLLGDPDRAADVGQHRLVTGDAAEAVGAMKQESRIELRTLGSVSLCRSLIRAELVNRFRVVVFPVITRATGRDRIYDGYPDVRLDRVESRTFGGGLQLLGYGPTVLDGPPGTKGAAG